jgi:hypothetical protein
MPGAKPPFLRRFADIIFHEEMVRRKNDNKFKLPSLCNLSNPDDRALIKELEDKMISAHGNAVVWKVHYMYTTCTRHVHHM